MLAYVPPSSTTKKFYVLPTEDNYVCFVNLRTKNDYFTTEHYHISFYILHRFVHCAVRPEPLNLIQVIHSFCEVNVKLIKDTTSWRIKVFSFEFLTLWGTTVISIMKDLHTIINYNENCDAKIFPLAYFKISDRIRHPFDSVRSVCGLSET